MPALQAVALLPKKARPPPDLVTDWHAFDSAAALVSDIPQSADWSTLRVQILFAECNAVLGQQLPMHGAVADFEPDLELKFH